MYNNDIRKLRKNASLKTVTAALEKDVARARRSYEVRNATWKAEPLGHGSNDRQYESERAFGQWMYLSDLHKHLKRLSEKG